MHLSDREILLLTKDIQVLVLLAMLNIYSIFYMINTYIMMLLTWNHEGIGVGGTDDRQKRRVFSCVFILVIFFVNLSGLEMYCSFWIFFSMFFLINFSLSTDISFVPYLNPLCTLCREGDILQECGVHQDSIVPPWDTWWIVPKGLWYVCGGVFRRLTECT